MPANKPTRKLTLAKPAKPSTKPVANTPVLGAAAAVQAASGRSNVAKPAKPGKPANEPSKPAAHIVRTAATIAKQATNFGELTDRDQAYFSFYAGFIRSTKSPVSIADIVASGKRPDYSGSSKPHDAGAVVRLCKAGLIATSGTGADMRLDLTKLGRERRAS